MSGSTTPTAYETLQFDYFKVWGLAKEGDFADALPLQDSTFGADGQDEINVLYGPHTTPAEAAVAKAMYDQQNGSTGQLSLWGLADGQGGWELNPPGPTPGEDPNAAGKWLGTMTRFLGEKFPDGVGVPPSLAATFNTLVAALIAVSNKSSLYPAFYATFQGAPALLGQLLPYMPGWQSTYDALRTTP